MPFTIERAANQSFESSADAAEVADVAVSGIVTHVALGPIYPLEFALPEPGTISTAIVHFRTEESTSGDGEAVPSNEQSFEFLLAGPENLDAVRADLEGRRFSALFIERSSEEQAQEAASGAEVSRYVPLHEEWLILEDKDEEAVAYLTTEEDGPIAEVAELRYSSASSLLLREEKEAGPNDSQ